MRYNGTRMLNCMYMDMAIPMPTVPCAHLLPFRDDRVRMCF